MRKNLLLLFVSIIFSLLCAELIFRYAGYHISYAERNFGTGYVSPFQAGSNNWYNVKVPHSTIQINQPEFRYNWVSNNEGLKEHDLTVAKTRKRIFVMGDSFTEGIGSPNDSTYPRLFEKLIQQAGDSALEVINCGTAGSDIFTEFKLFSNKLLQYKPDYVLVTFNSTDLYEFSIRGGFERFKENNRVQYRQPPWFEPLYDKSYFIRFIVHDFFQYDYRFLRPAEGVRMQELAISQICSAIDSFNILCAANNSKFGMLFHPMGNEFPLNDYQNTPLIAYCKKNGITYVDEALILQECNFDSSTIKKIYWPKDGHFNSKGYELLAQCAFELFEKQGWLFIGSNNNRKY